MLRKGYSWLTQASLRHFQPAYYCPVTFPCCSSHSVFHILDPETHSAGFACCAHKPCCSP